jgi:hypothetical protein
MIYSLTPPEYRNFDEGQLYRTTRPGYQYLGVTCAMGATIPFDLAGRYSNAEQLRRDFNSQWIDPID